MNPEIIADGAVGVGVAAAVKKAESSDDVFVKMLAFDEAVKQFYPNEVGGKTNHRLNPGTIAELRETIEYCLRNNQPISKKILEQPFGGRREVINVVAKLVGATENNQTLH